MKIERVSADSAVLRTGFVFVYKDAFGGAPYFETYTDEEVVRDIWLPHLQNGIIVLAREGESVIGFACALPLCSAPADVREFLEEQKRRGGFPIDFTTVWYNSELGVYTTLRKRGIGYALMRARLGEIRARGGEKYVARTAAEGSNSLHLYERIESTKLSELQNVAASAQVLVNKSQSAARVYLYGECAMGVKKIDTILCVK